MGLIGNLLGTPKEHKKEKSEHGVVTTPEFDITQYAKKLGVSIGVIAGATASALKLFKVEQVTSGMVIAAFGVTAAALLGVSLVMAVDLAARAFLTGSGAARKGGRSGKGKEDGGDGRPPPGSDLVAAPPGTLVWLDGSEEPRPVLAISDSGGKAPSFLVATGPLVKRPPDEGGMRAIEGTPRWLPADQIRAVRSAKWP